MYGSGILEGDFEGKCSECACYDSNVKVLQSGNKKTVINLSSASGSLSTCHAEVSKRLTFQLYAIAVATKSTAKKYSIMQRHGA